MSYAALFPFSITWAFSVLILVIAARPDSIDAPVRYALTSWIGLAGLFGLGIFIFLDRPILATAIFLFMFSLLAEHHKKTTKEFFENQIQTDIVTTKQKWLVEKIFDERPIAISDKIVQTYPPSN